MLPTSPESLHGDNRQREMLHSEVYQLGWVLHRRSPLCQEMVSTYVYLHV